MSVPRGGGRMCEEKRRNGKEREREKEERERETRMQRGKGD